VLPIVIGGLIYVCWRDPNLLMFQWFRGLGLEPLLLRLRLVAAPAQTSMPNWVILSLPDGLWVYAFTAFMIEIWRGADSTFIKTFWISLAVLLGAGSELGQLAGVVPGVFDLTDFLLCVCAGAMALSLAPRKLHLQGA
jgi:hypothetical protein